MIIDTSAIIAILYGESELDRFFTAINGAETRLISSASLVETSVILQYRLKNEGRLMSLINELLITISHLTIRQSEIAREAYGKYGKGLNSARLNFGDCFAYALAKDMREPLLFKGTDFGKTDVLVAEY